jgi:hypothetical protein
MIPDLQSCLLCDDVRREANGKFMLIGLFDAVQSARFPLTMQRLCMVSRWCSGEGEFEQRSRVLMPDQLTPLIEGKPVPVRLPVETATATNVEMFVNVAFPEAGTYWVEMMLNGDLKIRYPLRVQQIRSERRPSA